jgi:hypothetical protein
VPIVDPNATPFDLSAWMADTMPALLDAEAADDWFPREARRHTPVSDLMAEDSPLSAFLSSPDTPPDGTTRAERKEWHDARRAALAAAVEAVQDAEEDHAHLVDVRASRAAMDAFEGLQARAAKAKRDAEEGKGSGVPVRGPEQPATGGRW